ncbi:MAG: TonB-dependent receptor, partial [Myxococcota bacterium]|nr:TonB-dependent receptor [Myxococcota bacterium]
MARDNRTTARVGASFWSLFSARMVLAAFLIAPAPSALAEEAPKAEEPAAESAAEPAPAEDSAGKITMDNPDPLPEPELTGLDSEGNELLPESPFAESREHGGIEEMLVTASKRAETLQSVPISMTALGGETLRDAGITTFSDLQNFVPNLEIIPVTDTRSTSIRIRGIGSVGSNAGIDPSVGVFIDGVYQGRAGMSVGDLLDIERVEVLRGPQGTLYGKNTAAGAINIITRDPDSEQSVFLEGVAGKYNDLQFRGSANFPLLEDQLALRVAGYSSKRDGWDINRVNGQDVNNVDKWGMRAKLLWDVNDD